MSDIRRSPTSSSRRFDIKYGDRINDFIVIGKGGAGATSDVFKAMDDEGVLYALKILRPSCASDPQKRARFLREAKMMMRLEHPNVVYCYQVDDFNGQLVFVMEYIDGMQLNDWLDEYGDELDELTLGCLFLDILRGVNHAHEHNIYHRDLKPANVMMAKNGDRWCAKIIDFGIAREAEEPIPDDEKDKIIGTAAYMSPEEIRDPETVCFASDLYSVGVMLYEAVCGKRPFEGPVPELMQAHVRKEPTPPSQFKPDLSPRFEAILKRLLNKDPSKRYDCVAELINDLETVCQIAANQGYEFDEVSDPNLPGVQDPEDNILTVEWDRSEHHRYQLLLASLRNFITMAMSMILSQKERFKKDKEIDKCEETLLLEDVVEEQDLHP